MEDTVLSGTVQLTAIRLAEPHDIPAMQEIEIRAGRLFLQVDMPDVANDPPFPEDVLLPYIQDNRAWVAAVEHQTVGYALADIVDGLGHLEQLSVDPAFGRRGLGRTLLGTVITWARIRGFPAVTLRTFRDVPWNGPYYARLGFRVLQETELTPGLRCLREHERELGLDVRARHAMRLDLP